LSWYREALDMKQLDVALDDAITTVRQLLAARA
jgi:hypothetical protein